MVVHTSILLGVRTGDGRGLMSPPPPLPTEELLAVDGLWGKQSQFLSVLVCFFRV